MNQRLSPTRRLATVCGALVLLGMPSFAAAQANQLSGRAWSNDGSPIEGAVAELHPVADSTLAVYTLTNDLGFFSFRDLQPGTYALTVTRIGFAEHREEVSVTAGTTEVEVIMAGEAIALEGVSVEAERSRAKTRFEESAGITVQEIEAGDLKSIPVLIESDPLRAVEVLPGVTTVSDFSGSYNVRGGSADQNLILLDEVPIFNPFHLGNIFSVFNAD
ncbi:MAG: TonB-dependent receptor plug domain-containing protein, partial [Gemmatimonadetes bacterium]|nr:TonB-dependent receptor plug domain-containing protein [Gemmatimonadota bacterium]